MVVNIILPDDPARCPIDGYWLDVDGSAAPGAFQVAEDDDGPIYEGWCVHHGPQYFQVQDDADDTDNT